MCGESLGVTGLTRYSRTADPDVVVHGVRFVRVARQTEDRLRQVEALIRLRVVVEAFTRSALRTSSFALSLRHRVLHLHAAVRTSALRLRVFVNTGSCNTTPVSLTHFTQYLTSFFFKLGFCNQFLFRMLVSIAKLVPLVLNRLLPRLFAVEPTCRPK